MVVSLVRESMGRRVVRVDNRTATSKRTRSRPVVVINTGSGAQAGIERGTSGTKKGPVVVINNGPGAQALILKFGLEDKQAVSFARLHLKPAAKGDAAAAVAGHREMTSRVARSLTSGGSGAQPIELEWSLRSELSLSDIADALSKRLGSPTTVEIPDIVQVRGNP